MTANLTTIFGAQHDPANSVNRALLQAVLLTENASNAKVPSKSELLRSLGDGDALSVFSKDARRQFRQWVESLSLGDLQHAVQTAMLTGNSSPHIFDQLAGCLSDDESTKTKGAIFTPSWLAKELVKTSVNLWGGVNPGAHIELASDLSCGVGVFLEELATTLPNSRIVGVDNCSEYVAFARLLNRKFRNVEVHAADTLLSLHNSGQMTLGTMASPIPSGGYDLIVGNPPYVRCQLLDSEYARKLRALYPEFTVGNFDLSTLFLAHTIEALAPGGVAALVVSSKFMTSRYGAEICRRLGQRTRVLEIVDFGDGQVFEGRTTYICAISFAKAPPDGGCKVTSFPPGLKWNDSFHMTKGSSSVLPADRLKSAPWKLSSGVNDEILKLMHHSDCPRVLDIFTEVSQGIRTGANQFYVVPNIACERLERELLLPFVSGENIRRCEITRSKLSLLWPYRFDERGNVLPILENELAAQYPGTMDYFRSIFKNLSARNIDPNAPWYSYSRNQNLDLARRAKIIARELMPRSEFACDETGKYAICSGYALLAPPRMEKAQLRAWAAILCTPTMEFQLRHSCTQLHSGWFRILKQHLNDVRFPPLSSAQHSLVAELANELHSAPDDMTLWNALDELVAKAFCLTPVHRHQIQSYIDMHHAKSMPKSLFNACSVEKDAEERSGPRALDRNIALSLTRAQKDSYLPVELPKYYELHAERESFRRAVTFVDNKTKPIYRWYSFTQGFASDIVTELLGELGANSQSRVYDPFAGSGTTLLACKQFGASSFGAEISPLMCWITALKTKKWNEPELSRAAEVMRKAQPGLGTPSTGVFSKFLCQAYSPNILGQIFGWRDWIRSNFDSDAREFLLLGLISILEIVSQIRKHGSHYRFLNKSDSVGLAKLNIPTISANSDIGAILHDRIDSMINDIQCTHFSDPAVPAEVFNIDSRLEHPDGRKADIVITSPPYLNRNMYFAQQKAELVLLDYIASYEDYRSLVRQTFRSHVEGQLVSTATSDIPEVQKIVSRVRLSENNNAKIPHMICGYFDDLRNTLRTLTQVLSKQAKLAFVVGNCRWGGVVVPVDHLLAMLAEELGYGVERIIVTRMKGNSPQQMRKYGRIPIRESVVLLNWKG